MSKYRRIVVNIDPKDMVRLLPALAYLSNWCADSYEEVYIASDGPHDFIACYQNAGDFKPRYVIGAIWHEGTQSFSFHS